MLLNFHKIVVYSFFAQVIDCEKEKEPENGVEKLAAGYCSYDGGEVLCIDSCPPGQENCACGIMVYKHGRQIPREELYEYGILCLAAVGIPLTELTALVRFLIFLYKLLCYNRRLS